MKTEPRSVEIKTKYGNSIRIHRIGDSCICVANGQCVTWPNMTLYAVVERFRLTVGANSGAFEVKTLSVAHKKCR